MIPRVRSEGALWPPWLARSLEDQTEGTSKEWGFAVSSTHPSQVGWVRCCTLRLPTREPETNNMAKANNPPSDLAERKRSAATMAKAAKRHASDIIGGLNSIHKAGSKLTQAVILRTSNQYVKNALTEFMGAAILAAPPKTKGSMTNLQLTKDDVGGIGFPAGTAVNDEGVEFGVPVVWYSLSTTNPSALLVAHCTIAAQFVETWAFVRASRFEGLDLKDAQKISTEARKQTLRLFGFVKGDGSAAESIRGAMPSPELASGIDTKLVPSLPATARAIPRIDPNAGKDVQDATRAQTHKGSAYGMLVCTGSKDETDAEGYGGKCTFAVKKTASSVAAYRTMARLTKKAVQCNGFPAALGDGLKWTCPDCASGVALVLPADWKKDAVGLPTAKRMVAMGKRVTSRVSATDLAAKAAAEIEGPSDADIEDGFDEVATSGK